MSHLTGVSLNKSQSQGKRCLWKRRAINSRKTWRENCSLKVHRAQSREREDINSMWHIWNLLPWEKCLCVHVCLTHPWGPKQDGSQKNQGTLHQLLNKLHKFNPNSKKKFQDLYKARLLYDVRDCYLPNKSKAKFCKKTITSMYYTTIYSSWQSIYLVLSWQCGLTSETHTLGLHSWLISSRERDFPQTDLSYVLATIISTKCPPFSKHYNEIQKINAP